MTGIGRYAFANARARAMKSRLLERRDVMSAARRADARKQPVSALAHRRFRELVAAYATLIASYPAGEALFLSLVRLHEIENVKLAWRAIVRELPFEQWRSDWIELDRLASIGRETAAECRSLSALGDALKRTPYGAIAGEMRRAHSSDLAAAELGLDRWASRCIVDAALSLPRREHAARDLALAVVRERDLNVVRRAARTYALPPDAMIGAVTLVAGEIGAAAVMALGEWTPGEGPLWTRLPRQWRRIVGRPADWEALTLAWRQARRESCRRAFLIEPFCLAPGLAVLLLHEEEVRGINAIHEAGADPDRVPAVERALAAGGLGA
jgi:hypothetical protein